VNAAAFGAPALGRKRETHQDLHPRRAVAQLAQSALAFGRRGGATEEDSVSLEHEVLIGDICKIEQPPALCRGPGATEAYVEPAPAADLPAPSQDLGRWDADHLEDRIGLVRML
jgi:hypothetical protein